MINLSKRHMGKVVIADELEAKIALASRLARDKGEVRYYECKDAFGNVHYHLTSQPKRKQEVAA